MSYWVVQIVHDQGTVPASPVRSDAFWLRVIEEHLSFRAKRGF